MHRVFAILNPAARGEKSQRLCQFLESKVSRGSGITLARTRGPGDARPLAMQAVADDLQRKGYATRTIGIKLKYADFQVITRDMTLPIEISDGTHIRQAAQECLKRVPLTQRIRLLGVRAGALTPITTDAGAMKGLQPDLPF